jgi:hypothetical protein
MDTTKILRILGLRSTKRCCPMHSTIAGDMDMERCPYCDRELFDSDAFGVRLKAEKEDEDGA